MILVERICVGPRAPWEVIGNGDLFTVVLAGGVCALDCKDYIFYLVCCRPGAGCLNSSNYVEHETKETNYDSLNIVDN